MFTLIKRIIRSGWRSFSRDGEVAVATIFILFLSVMLVSSLFLFKDISKLLISKIEDKIDISIYFKEDILEDDIFDIREIVSEFPEVKEVDYVSPEEALEDFLGKHEEDSILLESIEEVGRNPFLASLNITAWDPGQYQIISNFLEKPEFEEVIEKIDYYQRKSVIDKVSSINETGARIGIIISAILIMVAVAVTFNTIRLSIYNSRKEIEIQRLVGASNWFIRGPFLVQGAICGIFSAMISALVFCGICWFFSPKIMTFFGDFNLYALFLKNFQNLLIIQFVAGIILGVISSVFAVRKYLKV
jgi:cell division transport system permease protein